MGSGRWEGQESDVWWWWGRRDVIGRVDKVCEWLTRRQGPTMFRCGDSYIPGKERVVAALFATLCGFCGVGLALALQRELADGF